jgi:uncharacterized protein YbjT (DUF2867 family)
MPCRGRRGAVTTVGRTATGQRHPKLRDVVHGDLFALDGIELGLNRFDACFFCLGVSAAGMAEAVYTRLTYDLTLSIARMLAPLNPSITFVYVSGAGTDATEQGRSMWARVKGRTENALLDLPFRAVYLFRPGAIQPLHGAKSKNTPLRLFYQVAAPVLSLLRWIAPRLVLSTEVVGQAMLNVARRGAATPILTSADIYMSALRPRDRC